MGIKRGEISILAVLADRDAKFYDDHNIIPISILAVLADRDCWLSFGILSPMGISILAVLADRDDGRWP